MKGTKLCRLEGDLVKKSAVFTSFTGRRAMERWNPSNVGPLDPHIGHGPMTPTSKTSLMMLKLVLDTSTIFKLFSKGIPFHKLGSDSSSGCYQGSFEPSTTSESYVSLFMK